MKHPIKHSMPNAAWPRRLGLWGWVAAAASGCATTAGSVPQPTGPTVVQQAAPGATPAQQAAAKFAALSRALEKLSQHEGVDAPDLRRQLQAIAQIDSDFAPAAYNLAVLQDLEGDAAGAEKTWRLLAASHPTFLPAQESVAALDAQRAPTSAVQKFFRQVVDKDPKNTTSRLALARLLLAEHHYKGAIELCREVLARQADAVEAFRVLGHSYAALGNLPMAELVIARGLRAQKDDVELTEQMAQLLLLRNDLAGGVEGLKEVIRLDPTRLSSRAHLAKIALTYRDFGNAAQQYEAILKQDPSLVPAQVNLAVSYKGLGRFDQAADLLQKVLHKDADHVSATWDLAVLYHRHLGRYDEAQALYLRYRQLRQGRGAATQAAASGEDAAIHLAQVGPFVAEIARLKSDQAALAAQQAHEKMRQAAIAKVCAAKGVPQPADLNALGTDQERIEAAWGLMSAAQKALEGADPVAFDRQAHCALALLPTTHAANVAAGAPMHVLHTQMLYQLGRLDEAAAANAAALKCDPANPDAVLIAQQLSELQKQSGKAPQPAADSQGANAPKQTPPPAPHQDDTPSADAPAPHPADAAPPPSP
jgi:tetratricopeptide (TPR) repeat protein